MESMYQRVLYVIFLKSQFFLQQKLSPSRCVHNKFWFSVLCEIFVSRGFEGGSSISSSIATI